MSARQSKCTKSKDKLRNKPSSGRNWRIRDKWCSCPKCNLFLNIGIISWGSLYNYWEVHFTLSKKLNLCRHLGKTYKNGRRIGTMQLFKNFMLLKDEIHFKIPVRATDRAESLSKSCHNYIERTQLVGLSTISSRVPITRKR